MENNNKRHVRLGYTPEGTAMAYCDAQDLSADQRALLYELLTRGASDMHPTDKGSAFLMLAQRGLVTPEGSAITPQYVEFADPNTLDALPPRQTRPEPKPYSKPGTPAKSSSDAAKTAPAPEIYPLVRFNARAKDGRVLEVHLNNGAFATSPSPIYYELGPDGISFQLGGRPANISPEGMLDMWDQGVQPRGGRSALALTMGPGSLTYGETVSVTKERTMPYRQGSARPNRKPAEIVTKRSNEPIISHANDTNRKEREMKKLFDSLKMSDVQAVATAFDLLEGSEYLEEDFHRNTWNTLQEELIYPDNKTVYKHPSADLSRCIDPLQAVKPANPTRIVSSLGYAANCARQSICRIKHKDEYWRIVNIGYEEYQNRDK